MDYPTHPKPEVSEDHIMCIIKNQFDSLIMTEDTRRRNAQEAARLIMQLIKNIGRSHDSNTNFEG